jgi:hypothetical protein
MKRAVAGTLPGLAEGQPLAEALDLFTGTQSLAEFVKGDREIALHERSTAWRSTLQAHREAKEEAFQDRRFCRSLFKDGEKQIGEIPDTSAPREEFETWLVAARVIFGVGGKCQVADVSLRPAFRAVLGARLGKAGYSQSVVDQAVAYVVPELDELVA